MLSSDFSKLKASIDTLLDPTLSKQDWARALGISIASLHRYLDEKDRGNVPDEVARLMDALLIFVRDAKVDAPNIREAIKATGVAGVVARAASAGMLPPTTVSLLASTPSLIWLGAVGGAVGAIVGAGALSFFQKIKPASDEATSKKQNP
jgi:hypothetical protein